jgi:hypothetical protein
VDAERLRTRWARVRRRGFAHNHDEFGEPWSLANAPAAERGTSAPVAEPVAGPVAEPEPVVRAAPDFPERRVLPGRADRRRDPAGTPEVSDAVLREEALVRALDRLADSFERVAAGLEADRHDRLARLDDVDGLLRELVVGLSARSAPPIDVAPTARPSVVVAGTIDLSETEPVAHAAIEGEAQADVDLQAEAETESAPEPAIEPAVARAKRPRAPRR